MNYEMVRSDTYKDGNSLYDILDHTSGSGRVLAQRVRYEAACEITAALNLSYSIQQDQRDDELGPDDAEFGMSDHR